MRGAALQRKAAVNVKRGAAKLKNDAARCGNAEKNIG